MSRVPTGSIPEKICYVFSDEQEVPVGCEWDISWYDNDDEDKKTVKEMVLPAFPADNSDEGMLSKAKSWAEQSYYNQPKKTSQAKVVDNKPINNVRIMSLEHRVNGGRAYKAAIDKFYVDVREDVVMDAILKEGISPGGILNGKYVWAKLISQMKLVRVGSELHNLVVEFESKKDFKPIGKKDLEFGAVYQDRKKNKAVFLGYVNTTTFDVPLVPGQSWSERSKNVEFKFKTSFLKKYLLFYTIAAYDGTNKAVKKIMSKDNSYYFNIRKTHNYIEKVGEVIIPKDIVTSLRNRATKEAKEDILEYTGHKAPKNNYQAIDAWNLQQRVAYNSKFLNLYPFEGTVVEPFDIKKFLIFS
jgi:hypothetical protein